MFEASYSVCMYPYLSNLPSAYAKTEIWRNTGYLNSYYPLIDINSVLNGPVDLVKQMC